MSIMTKCISDGRSDMLGRQQVCVYWHNQSACNWSLWPLYVTAIGHYQRVDYDVKELL